MKSMLKPVFIRLGRYSNLRKLSKSLIPLVPLVPEGCTNIAAIQVLLSIGRNSPEFQLCVRRSHWPLVASCGPRGQLDLLNALSLRYPQDFGSLAWASAAIWESLRAIR